MIHACTHTPTHIPPPHPPPTPHTHTHKHIHIRQLKHHIHTHSHLSHTHTHTHTVHTHTQTNQNLIKSIHHEASAWRFPTKSTYKLKVTMWHYIHSKTVTSLLSHAYTFSTNAQNKKQFSLVRSMIDTSCEFEHLSPSQIWYQWWRGRLEETQSQINRLEKRNEQTGKMGSKMKGKNRTKP